MAHETFEDPAIGAFLNAHFVSIKVDREERPDLDEVFMTAVQLASGRGGWPMTLFLTPDKKPFFAGTYFPKEDRGQHPGFDTIIKQIAEGWALHRSEFVQAADEFSAGLTQVRDHGFPKTFAILSPELIINGLKELASTFDRKNMGFGDTPKFPPHTSIELLFNLASTDFEGEGSDVVRQEALLMAISTLFALCQGGIHDHVGGGFHRYSTDAHWHLPHFEKMLYDNAMMVANLGIAVHFLSRSEAKEGEILERALVNTMKWLKTEMSESGFYFSAVDADSIDENNHLEEGVFYTWTEAEIDEVLGEKSEPFKAAYGIRAEGNFNDEATGALTGRNVISMIQAPGPDFASSLAALKGARSHRNLPSLDRKAIAAWNGLAIYGFTLAGQVDLAVECAEAWIGVIKDRKVPHQVMDGVPSGPGFLDDYAALALGLFTLSESVDESQRSRYVAIATQLGSEMISKFYDEQRGGFYLTSDDHELLFGKAKPISDVPQPSANAMAVRVLLRMGELDKARQTLEEFVGWMERAPTASESLLLAVLEYFSIAEPLENFEPVSAPATPAFEGLTVEISPWQVDESQMATATLSVDIPAGWHINSENPPARWIVPTQVKFEGVRGTAKFPEPANDRYEGSFNVALSFSIAQGREGEVRFSYQACTESECLEPKEQVFEIRIS